MYIIVYTPRMTKKTKKRVDTKRGRAKTELIRVSEQTYKEVTDLAMAKGCTRGSMIDELVRVYREARHA